jgi:16S rRNA (guanine(966)-N(2))-methyltransferase RsmD
MRIISGQWRGQTLKTPARIRPTTDRVREAIFSILGEAQDLAVLDLYAGSGSLGLEALSRGARGAHFVDISRQALLTIKDNLRGKEEAGVVFCQQDALEFLRQNKKSFDWIFCDPPYNEVNYAALLNSIAPSAAMNKDSLLILESDRFHAFDLPSQLMAIDRRKFGDTVVHFIKLARADHSEGERRA